jgi:hypothetical protein
MKRAGVTGIAIGRGALMGALMGAVLSCAGPASAQTQSAAGDMGKGGSMMPGFNIGGGTKVDDATLEKRREVERAYKDATQKIPSQATAVNDPWANMRGADEQKPAVKPVAKTAHKKKPAQ